MADTRNNSKGDFTKGSMAGNILRLTLPIMASDFVSILYNLVDRMFIGHMPGTGTAALTGVGLVLPLITLINASGSLIGIGTLPLFSIARGEKDDVRAEAILETAFSFLLIFGLLLSLVFVLGQRQLLLMIGADSVSLPYAVSYFSIYLIGTIPLMINIGINPLITAQGFARTAMVVVMIGSVLNIILDPIFIYTLGLGVQGAAAASVISQVVSAALTVWFLHSHRAPVRLRRLRAEREILPSILRLGSAGFIFRSSTSIILAIANNLLYRTGGALGMQYVAAMSVTGSLRELFLLLPTAMSSGYQPVLSYNYGARRFRRVSSGIRFFLIFITAYNTLAWLVLTRNAALFGSLFTGDEELLKVTVPCIRAYFCALPFMSLQMTGQYTFIAMNKAKQAIFFSLFRKCFLVVVLMIGLSMTSLGVMGVFYAEPLSEVLGGILTMTVMTLTIWARLPKEDPPEVPVS